ncbi:hypothetical protein JM80_3033 [Cellulophaga sp. RHA_52]|uniref:DUF5063 domain-containing protein n=1 Tax=Cellulophaga sp. RHA_52 TaxID=1250036 RepID=UPI00119B8494|nr:DUF5063 domain-containing protein [Cellulophaga sp. RHA_52]TVZ10483.1 hypothetical protein JM80_3033 [Cellulophaga sp. RHA_52]
MNELINIINEITKYGLNPNLEHRDKEKDLEKYLVEFYAQYFNIRYVFDKKDYEDYEYAGQNKIRENVISNFPSFGLYHNLSELNKIENKADLVVGDAVDDLTDIILDLLEIKWRAETNSESDAWWYFELIFYSHTQQHLIDLLNFMKHKNG